MIVDKVEKKVDNNHNIIILSDRKTSKNMLHTNFISLLYVHHSLIKRKKRSKFGIVIESAEPREPHHFSMLLVMGQVQLIHTWSMKL